jgi:hypothetical protein
VVSSGVRPISLLRLSAAFALIGLTTSRVSLVLHEFVGHGGTVLALGATVDDFRLFTFGGGWVSFHRAAAFSHGEGVAISTAGVVLELVFGGALLALAGRLRVGSPLRLLVIAFGTIDVLHGLFDLTCGTHHGYGDGRILHGLLGAARPAAVATGSALLLALGLLLGRRFGAEAVGWLPGVSVRGRILRIGAAAALAAGVHGGLTVAEQQLTADPAYAAMMKHESQRAIARDLRRETVASARPLSADEMRALRRALERRHAPFPLRELLFGGLAVAFAAGTGLGARRGTTNAARPLPPGWIDLHPLALACGLSLLVVLLLREPWWH